MMNSRKKIVAVSALSATVLVAAWILPAVIPALRNLCPVRPGPFRQASAVSQFSRRTGISCAQCHYAFPRLTPFGDKFKVNGFQVPGTQDGDEVGKQKIGDRLNLINDIGSLFGARVAFTPFSVKKAGLSQNNAKTTGSNVGNANWLQIFTAGPVYKNVSIFIETEFAGATLKNNWMYMGWHNIAGPEGTLNARVGALPMLDWHAVSGRLRANPAINDQILSGIKSSNGATGAEDQVGIEGANPGVELFGYRGPFLYSAVVQNGKNYANTSSGLDSNQDKNIGGTLGLRLPEGGWEGSGVTLFAMRGVDSKTTSTTQIRNNFYRVSPGLIVQNGPFDLHAAYMYAEDKNWTLTAGTGADKAVVRGFTGKAGYNITPRWWAALQYDVVESNDGNRLLLSGKTASASQDFHKLSPSLWFFPRENIRLGVTGRIDLLTTQNKRIHGYKEHEIFGTIRAMF